VSQARAFTSDDVVNLGLTVREGQAVQGFLKARYSYTGEINGQLDTESWKALQRELTVFGSEDDGVGVYTGPIDGIVDSDTISALQQLLAPPIAGYTGPIDGVANAQTEAAFAVYADTLIEDDGL
jgi:lysozyme family protein